MYSPPLYIYALTTTIHICTDYHYTYVYICTHNHYTYVYICTHNHYTLVFICTLTTIHTCSYVPITTTHTCTYVPITTIHTYVYIPTTTECICTHHHYTYIYVSTIATRDNIHPPHPPLIIPSQPLPNTPCYNNHICIAGNHGDTLVHVRTLNSTIHPPLNPLSSFE